MSSPATTREHGGHGACQPTATLTPTMTPDGMPPASWWIFSKAAGRARLRYKFLKPADTSEYKAMLADGQALKSTPKRIIQQKRTKAVAESS